MRGGPHICDYACDEQVSRYRVGIAQKKAKTSRRDIAALFPKSSGMDDDGDAPALLKDGQKTGIHLFSVGSDSVLNVQAGLGCRCAHW